MSEIDKPKIPRDFLIALAKNYEEGNPEIFVQFKVEDDAEQQMIAKLRAEELIGTLDGQPILVRFTDKGYRAYKPAIDFERTTNIP